MIRVPVILRAFALLTIVILGTGCGEIVKVRQTVRAVGPEKLREETLAACRDGFAAGVAQKVPEVRWPDAVRAFAPKSLWAEPDGAYLLLQTDADGERGVYIPRILSDEDPICTAKLTHEKLARGVYWYDRKRM